MAYARDNGDLKCLLCGRGGIHRSEQGIKSHERGKQHKQAIKNGGKMWLYKQTTGELLKPDGTRFAFGFAGQGFGLNNPAHQDAHNIGPLPQGDYSMTKWLESDPHLGLCVIVLEPMPGNSMFGRSAFRIHGARSVDRSGLQGFLTSSEGCVCIGDCGSRSAIWNSNDRLLRVVA